MKTKSDKQATLCVHAGVEPDATHQAIMTPIFQTSTYVQDFPGQPKTHDYGRAGNPTRDALEQSLAALDKIYGPDGRSSLENGAGLKLYITPRDEQTVKEVSASVGKMTSEAVTTSFGRNKGVLGATSTSSRLEERPLLSETEARFLNPDDVIILASPQHPIKARRIKYFEDPKFSAMVQAQEGKELPYPPLQRRETAFGRAALVEIEEKEGSATRPLKHTATEAPKAKQPGGRKLRLARHSGGTGGVAGGYVDPASLETDAEVPDVWRALITEGRDLEMG